MAGGLESAEKQLGCTRGHFLLLFPGSPARAAPGAWSRTRGLNVMTSLWLPAPVDMSELDWKPVEKSEDEPSASSLLNGDTHRTPASCQLDRRLEGKMLMNRK